ncbi:hypothetical protein EJF36_04720 [Bacillus sp. HMF5848]|uniref:PH domain-containing protein n=1 Tax=Bacillus sp. HMF5848 TaxID=2495421 RepID=UPI000F788E0F|nr:PH domain-containing protein [Bacillus sp. HMF5848]RSK26215.1 hypothetical protein EJF36_04720 [Bacillus sp. HMF5848]
MKFSSKKDPVLMILIYFSLIMMLVVAVQVLMEAATPANLMMGIILLVLNGVLSWTIFTTSYIIHDKTLTVKAGPLRWNININDIQTIKETNNPMASPALSLERLAVTYKKGIYTKSIVISPKNPDTFISELRKKNKRIR